MSVIIFGNGPLPVPGQNDLPVTAPGSRTWQIIRTTANGLAAAGSGNDGITVINLDETTQVSTPGDPILFSVKTSTSPVKVKCYALPYSEFIKYTTYNPDTYGLPPNVHAIVATGSVQPYSTAAGFARTNDLPLWVDVFGDPICENQSQAELQPDHEDKAVSGKQIHVWKLLLDALLTADRFSALSRRQRYALLGQLGCAGRLNQFTANESLVHYLPYSLFPDDLPPLQSTELQQDQYFTILWAGSFNTWMDVPTLAKGLSDALLSNPMMRLIVVGGSIPGYNEISYNQFLSGIRSAGVEGSVTLLDWQPLSAMPALYARANLGLSIDRFTYEAELGSRTRLINFLAAGLPVASTVFTELSEDLLAAELLLPFEAGDASSLTNLLLKVSEDPESFKSTSATARQHILDNYNGQTTGKALVEWIKNPVRSKDKQSHDDTRVDTNALLSHQRNLLASLNT